MGRMNPWAGGYPDAVERQGLSVGIGSCFLSPHNLKSLFG